MREVNLHVGGQHGKLGAGQHLACGVKPCLQFLIRGQELDGTVQTGMLFKIAHQALIDVNTQRAVVELALQQNILLNVGFKHLGTDFVPQGFDKRCALLRGKLAACHQTIHQNLDVHLAVTGFHTCGVVNGVGIDDNSVACSLHAAQLGEAQVTALAHDLGAQLVSVHTQGVVCLIAHLRVGFGRCLHVSTNTAVVEQINRSPQDRGKQLGGCQLGNIVLKTQHLAHLRGNRDGL